jgi:antibiotic biosynthesis monooxygenase (ABM) superfamily enzyme
VSEPFVIDFPGEYEHAGIVIRCRESGEQLHYILRFDNLETAALLLNPMSVDHDALKSVQNYFCVDIETKERIEQNEFEGEVMLFGHVNH